MMDRWMNRMNRFNVSCLTSHVRRQLATTMSCFMQKSQWDFQGVFQGHGTFWDPYYSHYHSHVRIPKDMGIVWEAYHKGVPCPWESLESPEKFRPRKKHGMEFFVFPKEPRLRTVGKMTWQKSTFFFTFCQEIPGSSKCVKFVPFQPKNQPKGRFFYISGRSRYSRYKSRS